MTEKMETSEIKHVKWPAFLLSLLAAPVLVTAAIQLPLYAYNLISRTGDAASTIAFFWALIFIGAGLYFVIGTPVLILHLRRHAPRMDRILALSLMSLFWLLPVALVFSLVNGDLAPLFAALVAILLGFVGAPPLAAVFTLLYRRFSAN